jgi:predicted Zn-dependent protease
MEHGHDGGHLAERHFERSLREIAKGMTVKRLLKGQKEFVHEIKDLRKVALGGQRFLIELRSIRNLISTECSHHSLY